MRAQEVKLTQPEMEKKHVTVTAHKKSLWQEIYRNRWSYIYLVPMIILLLAFIVYPIFASLGYTLYQWNGIGDPTAYVGLDNFKKVTTDPIFWESFIHTFIFTAVVVPVQLTLALILALILNSTKLRFATFYRSVYFLPVVMSPAVIGVIMNLMISNFGDNFNTIFLKLHLINQHIDWLADPRFVLWIIIAIQIWNTLGINMVYFLAGLQTIPTELYEAARIDGAGWAAQFFSITIPMLRGVGMIILFLAILGNLNVFDLVQVLTGGGPYFASNVVSTYIYQQAFGGFSVGGSGGGGVVQPNVGFASAASFFFGLILIVLTSFQALGWRYVRRNGARTATSATETGAA
ncbi:carbohydrate ABC transporter permease [Dictyobacter formicarum]|uniref:ABC transporter permease n=1 Tax=Dictyobacter formicarum TaxID=2778368 RepID=A0ABQ3VPT5_9CHLR|nr:sugar ABC transporter permease [Dictyobacter formicarum]GHO87608.1 ABC transporter permease [Dictyobacter formicarum]